MIGLALLLGFLAPQAPVAPATPPPRTLVTIPAGHRLIEGVATDGRTFWFSSVADREILVWRQGQPLRTIPMPAGTARPLGLAYDTQRDWLWIATDCPDILAQGACTGGALVAIDRAGRLKVKLAPEEEAHFGDVSVARGVVHVSDSRNGAVYACRDRCMALEAVIPPGVNRSAQSSAVHGDGHVLVADYGSGIVDVDAHGIRTAMLRDREKPLRGIDGLARADDWFVGVQNNQAPGVILAFRLATDGHHLADMRVIGEGPTFPEPTQIAIANRTIYIVSDAQWGTYDKSGRSHGLAQHATPILMLPLPK